MTASQRPLSQQLYEAYVASMKEACQDLTAEKDSNSSSNSSTIVSEASVEVNVISDPPAATFDMVAAAAVSGLPTPSFSTTSYQLHPSTLQSLDQIWELTCEVAHLVLERQAEIVCDLAKKDERIRVNEQGSEHEEDERSSKKRKVVEDLQRDKEKNVIKNVVAPSNNNCSNGEVDLHEDCSSDEGETMSSLSSSTNNDDHNVLLTSNAERMIRMTKYFAEMERFHGLFRLETESLVGDNPEEFL